jgi:tRNA pseudouridine55 synthase
VARNRSGRLHATFQATAGMVGFCHVHGVLVVDKPKGKTSAAVVAEVKQMTGAKRVGHTGTLDPMATGVLPICIGEATKIAQYLLADDKEYEAEAILGIETDTLDADGNVVATLAFETVTEADVLRAMAALTGSIEQVPPMFSAIRQKGQRLHELARRGTIVERAPRRVQIDRFELLEFAPPRFRFRVACSKGTYVRVLASDLGERLGTCAHLSALRRTRSGRFLLDQAQPIGPNIVLISLSEALENLPAEVVEASAILDVQNGKRLPWAGPAGMFRLIAPDGTLLALAEVEGGRLRYERVFTYGLTRGDKSVNLHDQNKIEGQKGKYVGIDRT